MNFAKVFPLLGWSSFRKAKDYKMKSLFLEFILSHGPYEFYSRVLSSLQLFIQILEEMNLLKIHLSKIQNDFSQNYFFSILDIFLKLFSISICFIFWALLLALLDLEIKDSRHLNHFHYYQVIKFNRFVLSMKHQMNLNVTSYLFITTQKIKYK